MQDETALTRLLQLLLRALAGSNQPDAIRNALDAIARSRPLLDELDALSSLLTGEPSMLRAQSGAYLTCQECLAAIDLYVEDWAHGIDIAQVYPRVFAHLAGCDACRTEAEELYALLIAAQSESEPVYITFAEWFERQDHAPASLWRRAAGGVHQLAEEIALILRGGQLIFGELGGGLTPRPAPVAAMRSGAEDDLAEVLELPHAEANLVVRLRAGPVSEGMGTVLLEIAAIDPAQPVARARVTLRDEQGGLLEGASSDEQGVVLFENLDEGKYQFQVEHQGQVWSFSVNLQRIANR
jgi:hypothetical protein